MGFLAKDARSKRLSRVIGQIGDQVSNGKSFHEALEMQGPVFPPVYASMVRVAEASGSLDTVLERIATGREKAQKLRSKALSEVLYPCMLIVMAIAAVTIMLTFVVPRFKEMIVNAGTEAPEQARMVIAASDWLLANGHLLAICLALWCRRHRRRPGSRASGASRWSGCMLRAAAHRQPCCGSISPSASAARSACCSRTASSFPRR